MQVLLKSVLKKLLKIYRNYNEKVQYYVKYR